METVGHECQASDGVSHNELEEEEGGIDEKQDLDPERSGGHRETDAVVVLVVGGSF